MGSNTHWFRLAGVAFAFATAAPAAQAALVYFADDRAGFVANTGATSIGSLPITGSVGLMGSAPTPALGSSWGRLKTIYR